MTTQSTATRLVDQAASDLEANRRLQQKLTDRITVLQQEEALLTDILNLAQQYEGFTDSSRLPEQLQDEPGAAATKAKRASTGAGARRSAPARTAAAGHTRKAGTKTKARGPLLGDLLMELLGAYEEPRLAKELRDELLAQHPDRNPTPQVVRNTLEALVAKGRIRRHKQQRSVMYTLVEPGSAT
ncbi:MULTISPECIES: hypothetical protein [unclassified Streptomyces]|uniref:hypothetical protein n=1 Tax=unclassified Streptomyces TaxID=2593676 RepID=UPI0036F61ADB